MDGKDIEGRVDRMQAQIRNDFPILEQKINNNPLIYFDNGATTQKMCIRDRFSICKCDKDNASCHVDKPQVVRNDKKLAKWNVVIQCHVNDMEIGIDVYFFLKPAEPRNIDQRV